ncbi:carnitine dehydratase, partial [Sulfolobus sp. F3]
FRTNTREYWVKLLSDADVPVAPILNLAEAFQNFGNALVYEESNLKYVGFPVKSDNISLGHKNRAPRLGEHTEEILLELGYTREDIQEFVKSDVIGVYDKEGNK